MREITHSLRLMEITHSLRFEGDNTQSKVEGDNTQSSSLTRYRKVPSIVLVPEDSESGKNIIASTSKLSIWL